MAGSCCVCSALPVFVVRLRRLYVGSRVLAVLGVSRVRFGACPSLASGLVRGVRPCAPSWAPGAASSRSNCSVLFMVDFRIPCELMAALVFLP